MVVSTPLKVQLLAGDRRDPRAHLDRQLLLLLFKAPKTDRNCDSTKRAQLGNLDTWSLHDPLRMGPLPKISRGHGPL